MENSLPLVTIQVIFICLFLDKHFAAFVVEFILVFDGVGSLWIFLHTDSGLKSTFVVRQEVTISTQTTCVTDRTTVVSGRLFSNVWDRFYRVA